MDLSYYFKKGIRGNKQFREALKVAKDNSLDGNIWVIGGAVYRSIVRSLYNSTAEEVIDFDFILEKPVDTQNIRSPNGWKLTKTSLGEPRFVKGKKQIDLVDLNNSVNPAEPKKASMDVKQKIESYFRRCPLTIQAIVYDVNSKKIIGDTGIQAIMMKEITINNLTECISSFKRRKISIRQFIKRKASSLNFKPV